MMPIEPDHYGVLELEPCSPMEDVKSQYRRLAKRDHPDLHGNDAQSQEQFRRVNAAYTFLADAPRKAAYDAVLQAAQRAGAPPLSFASSRKTAPSPQKSAPAPTGYHAPVTPADLHSAANSWAPDAVRMTRSAWLGATAGVIVVMLIVALSLDGSSSRRPMRVEVAAPVASGSMSGDTLGNESEPGGGSEPGEAAGASAVPPTAPAADAAPPTDATPATSTSDTLPATGPALRRQSTPIVAPLVAPVGPRILGSIGGLTQPHPEQVDPARADPAGAARADALRRLLLARYHAVLPRTDRILNRGYAVRAADPETEDGSRRILREQLTADLADLSAARARLRPALARLSERDTPEKMHQEAGPILTDLARLEEGGKPVRDDIKALAAVPAASHAAPVMSRFGLPGPARPAVGVPASVGPAPAVVAVAPPASSENPALATKPKTPASSGEHFITWDNKQ